MSIQFCSYFFSKNYFMVKFFFISYCFNTNIQGFVWQHIVPLLLIYSNRAFHMHGNNSQKTLHYSTFTQWIISANLITQQQYIQYGSHHHRRFTPICKKKIGKKQFPLVLFSQVGKLTGSMLCLRKLTQQVLNKSLFI